MTKTSFNRIRSRRSGPSPVPRCRGAPPLSLPASPPSMLDRITGSLAQQVKGWVKQQANGWIQDRQKDVKQWWLQRIHPNATTAFPTAVAPEASTKNNKRKRSHSQEEWDNGGDTVRRRQNSRSSPIPIPKSQHESDSFSSSYRFPMYDSPPVTPPGSTLYRAHRFIEKQLRDGDTTYWDRQWQDGPAWAPFWHTPPGTPPETSPREELLSNDGGNDTSHLTSVLTTRYMSEFGDDEEKNPQNCTALKHVQWMMSPRSFSDPSPRLTAPPLVL